ncbi:cytokine-induced anti-apoptosis inhibitor 1, Fe-S biogenesis-domain-containing protein [Gongronella butleri]|nr:cytokine-induced anti-apoptosis inhibitor 1, Fe-S biogenesis-domain-containing protein [Gongronella butleri]
MAVLEHQAGDKVLYVAPSTVNQEEFLQAKNNSQAQVGANGAVAFEVLERVADAPLNKASYNTIYSNSFLPTISTHTTDMISRYLGTLSAGGRLVLTEPVLIDDLPNSVSPIRRKDQDLVSMLKLAGFVNVTSTVTPVSDDVLLGMFQLWGGNANRVEQGVKRLSGKFGIAQINADKPNYEVGQKMKLNFKKKATTTTPAEKKKVWTISNDDDMEDDDALLDEEDKIKPSKESLARPDDCEMDGAGRRKACKNCTCGRADAESAGVVSLDLTDDLPDEDNEIIEVDPTPKKVGGCGSCALGDAFRCSTCPYLGMPAFNEGEKVVLGGMFGQDDI